MSALSYRSRPASRRGRRSSWLRPACTASRCCSAAMAACSGSCSRRRISKPENDVMRARFWLSLCLALTASPLHAAERLNVVASFSILGDFVRTIGGNKVNLTTLVGPDSDVHVYTPTPLDAQPVADARLLVVNGLGLEGWLPRLLQSSASKAQSVVATTGVVPLKLGSDADPHAWQSVANAKIYVTNIRDALMAADPADAESFRSRA